jgi:para-nitrobenzyl esterase
VPNVGKVEGLDMAPCGYPSVNEFRGIPYAEPTNGSLRWQPPKMHAGWGKETLKATAYGNSCMQPDDGRFYTELKMDEDCLFLNIATPKAALENGAKKLPVMLVIHGGTFYIGSGNQGDIHGDSLVATSGNRVVAVSINYRLGVFGFLGGPALGSEHGVESLGIQDQRAAIAWVKANIGAFGGDGDDITLVGESSGGVSLLYHLTQPASFPLYTKIIIESGTFLNDMRTVTDGETVYKDLLNVTNCTSVGIACLLAMDAKALLDASDVARGSTAWLPMGRETPATLIASNRYNNKVPVILGSSRDEGTTFVGAAVGLKQNLTEAEFDNMEPYSEMTNETVNALKRIYSQEEYRYPANLGNYSIWHWMHMRFFTDSVSKAGACSVRWLGRALLSGGSPAVYAYLFGYPPKFDPRTFGGVFVSHGLIVPYVNGDLAPTYAHMSVPADQIPAESQKLAQAMAGYWSSFAISSNPSGGPGEDLLTWPMFTAGGDKVLRLNVESAGGMRVQEGLRRAACDWQTGQAQDWLPVVTGDPLWLWILLAVLVGGGIVASSICCLCVSGKRHNSIGDSSCDDSSCIKSDSEIGEK